MHLRRSAMLALMLGLIASVTLFGQADTALIIGNVSDATGAVIPGAKVTFAHLATGTEYEYVH